MRSPLAVALCTLVVTAAAHAQPAGVGGSPWRFQIDGGAVHQFDADLDDGGSFSVDRAFVEGGVNYLFSPRDSVGVAVGYAFDGYDFDTGGSGLAALDPWSDVHGFSVTLPARLGVGDNIDLFVAPSVRWRAESGGDLGESTTGGAVLGGTWRFSDRLRLGAGLGVFSEIEDDADVFPILLIDWQITDTVSLETGQGTGATRGPGLVVNWTGIEAWTFSLGARYETWRFRLDDSGPAPDGVGEEEAIPIYLVAAWEATPRVRLSVVGGLEVAGTLTLEDEDGRELEDEDVDPAPFLGATFRARF